MTYDWGDYLVVARQLNAGQNDPYFIAKGRSAISRAYYSAYHAARQTLIHKYGLKIPRHNSHYFVINQYKTKDLSLSKRLEKMKCERERCDYENAAPISQVGINSILYECTLLVFDFNKFGNSP